MAGVSCPRCLFGTPDCLCALLPSVAARTQVTIVRHVRERHRASNTGRLAHLALRDCTIVDFGERTGAPPAPDVGALAGAWILYPEGPVLTAPPAPPPRSLIVLDATWSQSRKMRQHLPWLRGLPVLHAPVPAVARDRMRNAPAPGMVSTLEAIAYALGFLEGDSVSAPLLALFDAAVARSGAVARRGEGHRGESLDV